MVLWISSSTPLLAAHQEVFIHFSKGSYRPKEDLCPSTCFRSRQRKNFVQQLFSGLFLSVVYFILAYDQESRLDDGSFPLTIPCSQKRLVLDINVLPITSMSRLKHLLEIPALSTVNKFICWMTQPPFLSFSFRHTGWIADQKKIKSRIKSKLTTPSICWQLSILDLKAYSSLAEFCSSVRAVWMCYCHCVVEAQFVNSNYFPLMLEV